MLGHAQPGVALPESNVSGGPVHGQGAQADLAPRTAAWPRSRSPRRISARAAFTSSGRPPGRSTQRPRRRLRLEF